MKNVILIAVDTLRADHLGCYGYERMTSPHIDAFAHDSVLFERHFSPAIPTHPAFTTINTGQQSITHGVIAHGGQRPIPRNAPWLPQLLGRAGLTTCAVDNLSQWHLDFHRGFEFYIDPTQRRKLSINADNREINRRVLPWLEQHHTEPFYLFVHYWDPHTPYLPPRAYRSLFYQGDPCDPANASLAGMENHALGRLWRENWFPKLTDRHITDARYVEAMYDGEIRYCDEGVGRLLETVDQLGLRDNTVVALLGDHGEMMYRHGIFFDHHGLYDGNIHVPFIVRCPGIGPRRVNSMTTHFDVAPTLLDLVGAEVPPEMEGVSLSPWMRGERGDSLREFVVCEECTWQAKWALRTTTHKFILARQPDAHGMPMRELYDLRNDPDELNNIAGAEPALASALENQLENWLAENMRRLGLTEDPLITHGITLGKDAK